jgi:hypothetical protein
MKHYKVVRQTLWMESRSIEGHLPLEGTRDVMAAQVGIELGARLEGGAAIY